MVLTSMTAPGKVFADRSELANHYKSDWHKYNSKRREAGMPMLAEEDFQARLEAALALRKEREGREARTGKDHLKNKDKKQKHASKKQQQPSSQKEATTSMEEDATMTTKVEEQEDSGTMEVEEGPPVIDPRQCLFDNTMCTSVKENIDRMYRKYGFFIPDQEYLVSAENLVGYCAEKIKLGHLCLYCQKSFSSWQACQQHMIMTRHTKIRYERGIDQEEFDVFYDFTEADAEFLGTTTEELRKKQQTDTSMDIQEEDDNIHDDDDDDSGEWEDVDEEDEDMEEEDDDVYGAYKDEIAKHGFDITPLGELVFPDGRIIGHRGLSRYYKQRFAPTNQSSAVVAARRAAGERLYQGQVYDTYQPQPQQQQNALALAKAGIAPGAAKGRQGRGILVSSSSSSSYTALSLYRYKAAMKKSRRDEFRGRRLHERTSLPMNKMDKKHNRLMNGVSVAHAAR